MTLVKKLKLLFVSSSVGALGSGLTGGVERTLESIARSLKMRGHQIWIVAPKNSQLADFPVIQIPGNPQISAQTLNRTDPIILPENAALVKMWEYVRSVQFDYDLIVNFAYDWLPFYLTPFFNCPIAHLVSMGSLINEMDRIIAQVAQQFPQTIGVHSLAQAATFPFLKQYHCVGNGFDLSAYEFCEHPQNQLAWIGRIAPEKGLEDAVAAAQFTEIPLKIMGIMQHRDYWEEILKNYPDAPVEYLGFLTTQELQNQLRCCRGLLMTPRWVEAFGNVAIEALACGVPIIAYRRGGPTEIVQDGKTGFLVEPDSIAELVTAIGKLDEINRHECRKLTETEYSLEALGDRIEQWFSDILNSGLEHG